METIGFLFKHKKLEIHVKKLSFIGRYIGLMFSSKTKKALIFEFKEPSRRAIHSFFVFYDFLAIWLDKNNRVIDAKIVKPFNPFIMPEKPFKKLIEIPINQNYEGITNIIVGWLETFK